MELNELAAAQRSALSWSEHVRSLFEDFTSLAPKRLKQLIGNPQGLSPSWIVQSCDTGLHGGADGLYWSHPGQDCFFMHLAPLRWYLTFSVMPFRLEGADPKHLTLSVSVMNEGVFSTRVSGLTFPYHVELSAFGPRRAPYLGLWSGPASTPGLAAAVRTFLEGSCPPSEFALAAFPKA